MKKIRLLLVVCFVIVMVVGANISAFDECSHWSLLQASGSFRYTQAGICPGPDTYPHAHQVVAQLWVNPFNNPTLLAAAASPIGFDAYYPVTESRSTAEGLLYPDAIYNCPTILD